MEPSKLALYDDDIYNMYMAGNSVAEIARMFGVKYSRMSSRIERMLNNKSGPPVRALSIMPKSTPKFVPLKDFDLQVNDYIRADSPIWENRQTMKVVAIYPHMFLAQPLGSSYLLGFSKIDYRIGEVQRRSTCVTSEA
jgi:hypothetical protein